MAFLSKIGGILKQTASMQLNARLSESRPGLFQVFRSMSSAPSSKLFVGGISFQTDDQSLKEAFSKYGEVVEARVIVDRETGRSRGFGFITYTSTEDASSALQALDGQILHGRQVRVDYANDRPRRNFGGAGSYGGGGGGGYGGGNYGGVGYGGGGGNIGYGNSGNYGGQGSYDGDNYGTGGGVGYGSNFGQSPNYDNGSFEVAGGGSGNDGFAAGGENVGFGGGDQLGSAEDSYKEETAGFGLNDPPSDNFQDEEEDRNGDLSKRV
ncbi:glycine-rich RNA-binding protein 4, mitochondrial-like [Gossypium arboreum]|uniref:RRM domain-containing protein n=1 Tax=Gossypium arboreum TaxID=29729 RepID=A0ABR0R3Z0_GOSAR|nr:glycine-rich RNA-binding protein 4, mitochondrial-like [Gossypium arboreum]KAK5846300.1 hypothetical protein PVK06_002583 [Gossypium arboreum]